MIGYVTVGADDMALAQRFYSALLPRLGYDLEVTGGELSFTMPVTADQRCEQPAFYVKRPWNGEAAAHGNGTMVAFRVPRQAMLRELHAAALAAGGRDEGPPGFRTDYSANFFVGYLRDPQGNKIALYCNSTQEPGRPD